MPIHNIVTLTRRTFIGSVGALLAPAVSPAFGTLLASDNTQQPRVLHARPGVTRIAPEPYATTPVWCYNDTVPGPEIRVRQGDHIQIVVPNELDEETTVHWHGLRVPNDMDGVPHLTQTPIGPNERFVYEFQTVDAGTFWYHPHQRGFEQVERGLYGAFIVDELEPITVDRDITWILDDWRLTKDATIREDFGNMHDASHSGRIGNTVTINGKIPDTFHVRHGERVRLRLINAANARVFALRFSDHTPIVIALDGQPIEPHAAQGGIVVLGPAMRADLVIDMTNSPKSLTPIIDEYYPGLEYRLVTLEYADEVLRDAIPDWSVSLPPNPIPEPNIANATRHDIVFNGGMMGGMVMQEMGADPSAQMDSMMGMMHSGKIWFINGIAAEGHVMDHVLTLERNQSYIISMTNMTAWDHPIHLHGHSFRVISRNGTPTRYREWQDTVLMHPRDRVDIAFVADNPGDWMFHCHILEHQAAGMMAVIRVT